MKQFWAAVEAKVKAAALGSLVASILAAILSAILNGSPIPDSPHAWAEFLIIVAGPPVVSFLSGWRARHTSIPPVPTAKTADPTTTAVN